MGQTALHVTVVDLGMLEVEVESPDELTATVVDFDALAATVEDA